MMAVLVLLAANIVVPLLWGDVYPFTSADVSRYADEVLQLPRLFTNWR